MTISTNKLIGERYEIFEDDELYPKAFKSLTSPPQCLRIIGNPKALQEGLAIVGARKATPYGISAAKHFARLAAEKDIVVISGGARGCDTASHQGALERNGKTVVILGGGCDEIYPPENYKLFQEVIEANGAIVSERDWTFHPMQFTFRERNRLIASLARATLIVEAGLPSGTFSTADAALSSGKEVLVVPGSINSPFSLGANRLIYQGATPIVDDDTFFDQLFTIYGCMKQEEISCPNLSEIDKKFNDEWGLYDALRACSMNLEEMHEFIRSKDDSFNITSFLMVWLAEATRNGLIAQYPDGKYGPVVSKKFKKSKQ